MGTQQVRTTDNGQRTTTTTHFKSFQSIEGANNLATYIGRQLRVHTSEEDVIGANLHPLLGQRGCKARLLSSLFVGLSFQQWSAKGMNNTKRAVTVHIQRLLLGGRQNYRGRSVMSMHLIRRVLSLDSQWHFIKLKFTQTSFILEASWYITTILWLIQSINQWQHIVKCKARFLEYVDRFCFMALSNLLLECRKCQTIFGMVM